MRLYLLPANFTGEPFLTLDGKDYNYLIRVLRLGNGSSIMGRDKNGGIWDLQICSIDDSSCTVSVSKAEKLKERTDTLPESGPSQDIILYQCMPKGRKSDDIVRMACEAGVRKIVFVKSRNCTCDFSGKDDTRFRRLGAVVKEAIQQSGSCISTEIEGIIDIADVPSHLEKTASELGKPSLGILFHQSSIDGVQTLPQALDSFCGVTGILIGSEGGFTYVECSDLVNKGFKAVMLKTNILRCETAAIYAVGAVQTIVETTCA